MLTTIEEASKNFLIHQIREEFTIFDGASKKRTLIAYIDIKRTDDTDFRVYIAADTNFMQKVSKLFLEEDESDEETLIDMALETTNLIVGSAKVLSEENTVQAYTISTPQFETISVFDIEVDSVRTLCVDGDELTIAIKELNV